MIPEGVGAIESRITEIEAAFGTRRATVTQPASLRVDAGAFDNALMTALGGQDATTAASIRPATLPTATTTFTPDQLVRSGGVNSAGVPVELARYGNGNIPAIALTTIGQGSHKLWDPAARAFNAMAQHAAADGIELRVTDSYRSYDEQVDLAERKGLYSQGGLAARPGTSEHGWGKALDINTSDGAVEWLRANAATYGFAETTPREPWHWVFQAA